MDLCLRHLILVSSPLSLHVQASKLHDEVDMYLEDNVFRDKLPTNGVTSQELWRGFDPHWLVSILIPQVG